MDIDTDAQIFSEIWGWRIRVGDWFSAEWSPVPFKYIWKKRMSKTLHGMPVLGAVYQSVLSNITWLSTKPKSKFQQEVQSIMTNDKINGQALSIRLSLDMFDPFGDTANFTIGRLKGESCCCKNNGQTCDSYAISTNVVCGNFRSTETCTYNSNGGHF